MTGSDMVYNFQQMLESISPTYKETDRLNTWEILSYLNRTVERYIKMKYLSGRSFQENVFKIASSPDDLVNLYRTTLAGTPSPFLGSTDGMLNTEMFLLPDDFMAYVRSDLQITRTAPFVVTPAEWMPAREIDYNQIDPVLTTPFNKPILEAPLVTIDNQLNFLVGSEPSAPTLLIIHDDHTTLADITVTYVGTPTPIDMDGEDCQLAVYLHEEIVKMAVSMYMDEYKLKLAQKQ